MNAATVSKALKAQGFIRSEEGTTRIRGWHHFSRGFQVKQGHSAPVVIFYEIGSGYANTMLENRDEIRSAQLAAMARFLTSKGYELKLQETYIAVTGKVSK